MQQDKETRQDTTRQDKETRQDRARQDQLPVPLPPTGVPSQLALHSHWISRKTYDQNDKTRKQDKMRQDRYKTRPVTCAATSNRGSSQLVLHSRWISRIRKTYITKNNQTRKQTRWDNTRPVTCATLSSRGSSQLALHSQWLSRKVRTLAVAASAPFTRDRISPAEIHHMSLQTKWSWWWYHHRLCLFCGCCWIDSQGRFSVRWNLICPRQCFSNP